MGCGLLFLLPPASADAGEPFFGLLDDLPGGASRSDATAISDDGFFVAGTSFSEDGEEVVLWTADGGMTSLGSFPSAGGGMLACNAVSSTGVVAGTATSPWPEFQQDAFVATEESGVVGIGYLDSANFSWGLGLSDDGVTVVGRSGDAGFVWSAASGMEALPSAGGGSRWSEAHGISSSGEYAVGSQYEPRPDGSIRRIGTRWAIGGDLVEIDDALPSEVDYTPVDASADGRVVVGSGFDPATSRSFAFVWTETGGIREIPPSPGGVAPFGARAVSADGQVVLGSGTLDGAGVPYLWDAWRGAWPLNDRIEEAGIDSGDWEIVDAYALSEDGSTIVGSAFGPGGRRGFVVHLPEPGGLSVQLTAIVAVLGLARRRGTAKHRARRPDWGEIE